MASKLKTYPDFGRVIAYYPSLRELTGSTTSNILLCQFLYWSDKTKKDNGWIYKTSDEIEEETGLTYNEQRNARKKLADLGILESQFKRLSHSSRYKLNLKVLTKLWEEMTGKKAEFVQEEPEVEVPEGLLTGKQLPIPEIIEATASFVEAPNSALPKAKDGLGGWLELSLNSPNAIKEKRIREIRDKMEVKFHLNMDSARWIKFLEFMYGREKNHGESADRFIEWALENGYDPLYWSADRMKTLHPQAYLVNTGVREDFIQPLPERVAEDFAPMPKDLGKKKNLY